MRGKQWAFNRCGYDVACELPGAGRGVRWEWRGEGRRASPGWNLLFSLLSSGSSHAQFGCFRREPRRLPSVCLSPAASLARPLLRCSQRRLGKLFFFSPSLNTVIHTW